VAICYLLHLDPAYRHARHYLGSAASSAILVRRLHKHATGRGTPLLQAALAAGGAFVLVRLWVGTPALEHQLKRRKAAPRLLCPACPTRAQARRLAAGQALLPSVPGSAPPLDRLGAGPGERRP